VQPRPRTDEKRSKLWFILIALWLINGSSFLAIKVTIDTIPPLLSAGLRFTVAGVILFTIFYMRGYHKKERITKQQWKHAVVLGFTLFLLGQGLLTWGAQYLSSGMTGLLNSTVPLWIAIVAYVIYRKHFSKSTLVGLGAGFGGLMLLVAPSIGTGTMSPVGTVALLISSVSWAVGSLYSSKANLPVSILASSAMVMITGGMMLTAISTLLGEYHSFYLSEISPQSLTALVYLTAVVTIVGFTDFYWLVRVTTPSLANTFAYVSPVIAVILGWALLHEEITIVTIIAMSVILAGVAIMVTTPGKRKKNRHSDMQRVEG
jgi:drug/metabolite transporter (DMT)-like permease